MNDTAIGAAMVGRLLRRRWPVFMAIALVGALLGLASSFVLSPGYVSTSKVLLQGDRDAKQLGGETYIATSLVVLDQVAAQLGGGQNGAQLRSRVSASLDGNVITISGKAPTPEGAQLLTRQVTAAYVDFSTQIVSDAAAAAAETAKKTRDLIQKRLDEANARIAQLQTAPGVGTDTPAGAAIQAELAQERTAVSEATKDLQQLDTATSDATVNAAMSTSSASVIEPAVRPLGEALPTPPQLVVVGAVLLVVLGVIAHLVGLRLDRRLRDTADVAAALGGPVLGTVAVDSSAARTRSWIARLLPNDRSWAEPDAAVAEDGRGRAARWERILHRAGPSGSWVVVVVEDDPLGAGVVAGLASALAKLGPVTVLAEEHEADRIRQLAGDITVTGPNAGSVTGTVVRVLCVAPRRPVVADALALAQPDPALLIALGTGSRTAWELAGIGTASAEAGYRCVGAVIGVPASLPAEQPAPAEDGQGTPEMAGAS